MNIYYDSLLCGNCQIKGHHSPKKTGPEYEFRVMNPEQINFDEISSDLSYSNPVAFIEVTLDGYKRPYQLFAIIHSSVFEKAETCDAMALFPNEVCIANDNREEGESMVIHVSHRSKYSQIMDVVRAVKKLPYPDGYRMPATVKVRVTNLP